ncbi:hypothetical protein AKUG0803_UNKNOWN200020 (plasmid) [Apilactobacillus kunkeei]|nr:hypothetical protein AKUG0804_UNKNOWN200020 [Apilactobacillus kunkeei]CAI2670174.1 hypothetical protein AKUG0401_UNKNOWN200020 [Apilactobacillus kunkeei]CAI2672244.1 hypothetical protein AKUG0405_UNKNOWN200020 [Apilactobacillus kunkeei]CAI2674029.1 hypothetical protein AKUG0103_UNKNOWN200020 [Apilactobacillus kunkeei]CAI2674590.1 hypothetical protein AKUG0803_UNKNOWN200020 [Apilactobacillus kunkeei]
MKNTKTISKLAMFVATLAAGATIASIHVAAHADTLWAQGTTQSDIDAVNAMNNYKPSAQDKAEMDAIDASYKKHDDETGITKEQETGYGPNVKTKQIIRTLDTHKVISSSNKTSVAQKKTTKKVAKKARKKVVKKAKAKKLFRIRVKAHKIYAYKTIKLHKAGRKAEYKGTKLNVYKIVKKGHKTYYKVYGGRVITANKHFVTKIAK